MIDVREIAEVPLADEANELLRTGWKLLSIKSNFRGPIYILGAPPVVTLVDQAPLPLPTVDIIGHRPEHLWH